MARRSSFSSSLYRGARAARTIDAVASGNPGRVGRRGRNVAVGRAAARGGFWRRIFG